MKYVKFLISVAFIPVFIFSQNEVCFDLIENPNPDHPALGIFTKYVNVLNTIHVYAEPSISDAKVLHVASVAAELLDNNEDGVIDDPLLEQSLVNLNTIMPIFQSENGNTIDTFFDNFDDGCAGAVLFRNEIEPSHPGHWGEDATVEEVLHTINGCGHVEVYPSLYHLEPNSSYLTDAMDVARGGQFIDMPDTYPDEAWYHYDDWTCEYECMAMEYLYWCIVTNMDILSDSETCAGIANEWEPCTPELFEVTDTLMFNLITNQDNKLPQFAPDGNYCPSDASIEKKTNRLFPFLIYPNYPNPFNSETTIRYNLQTDEISHVNIYDITGTLVKVFPSSNQKKGYHIIQWNATDNNGNPVPSGMYVYTIRVGSLIMTDKMLLLK